MQGLLLCSKYKRERGYKLERMLFLLQGFNNDKVFSYAFLTTWSSCSCFSPRDFLRWEHLKNLVYWRRLASLAYVQEGIILLVKNISVDAECKFYISKKDIGEHSIKIFATWILIRSDKVCFQHMTSCTVPFSGVFGFFFPCLE